MSILEFVIGICYKAAPLTWVIQAISKCILPLKTVVIELVVGETDHYENRAHIPIFPLGCISLALIPIGLYPMGFWWRLGPGIHGMHSLQLPVTECVPYLWCSVFLEVGIAAWSACHFRLCRGWEGRQREGENGDQWESQDVLVPMVGKSIVMSWGST